MTEFVPTQTSVPDFLMTYSRQLADVYHGRKLNRMYVVMLEGFLKYQPWKANPPYPWRVARIHTAGLRSRKSSQLGWSPMNMVLPLALIDQIKNVIEEVNQNDMTLEKRLSVRTFLYTAVCWWCTEVHEYKGAGILPG